MRRKLTTPHGVLCKAAKIGSLPRPKGPLLDERHFSVLNINDDTSLNDILNKMSFVRRWYFDVFSIYVFTLNFLHTLKHYLTESNYSLKSGSFIVSNIH